MPRFSQSSLIVKYFMVVLFFTVPTNHLDARFLHSDADEIDHEEKLGFEAYIDILSYRYSDLFLEAWERSDIGVRASQGSLDGKRFHVVNDFKIATDSHSAVDLSYAYKKHQDVAEDRISEEVRLTFNSMLPFYISLMGDGDTYKKWGDLGSAIGVKLNRNQVIDVYYFSVDHFFNTKDEEPTNKYPRKPWTVGAKIYWQIDHLLISGFYEYDSPLRLKSPKRNFQYDYWRKEAELSLRLKTATNITFELTGYLDLKREEKKQIEFIDDGFDKGMERHINTYDFNVTYPGICAGTAKTGMQYVQRIADFSFAGGPALDAEVVEEQQIPDINRYELLYYHFLLFPLDQKQLHFFNTGLMVTDVKINRQHADDEDHNSRSTEIKYKTAWEYKIGDHGLLELHASWNIDRLIDNYPYKERDFRPWNGGNIQVQIVF